MRHPPEPETRVGICGGEACRIPYTWSPVALYKVPGIYRYRCASCFKRETGFDHHLAPR